MFKFTQIVYQDTLYENFARRATHLFGSGLIGTARLQDKKKMFWKNAAQLSRQNQRYTAISAKEDERSLSSQNDCFRLPLIFNKILPNRMHRVTDPIKCVARVACGASATNVEFGGTLSREEYLVA